MSTWQTIFGVEPPVLGRVHEIERARDEFDVRRAAAQAVVNAFNTVNCGGDVSGRLEGPVGVVFGEIAAEVATSLDDLPRVAQETSSVLDHHLERLRALRTECDEALGRARTAWSERNRLDDERPRLENLVRSLRTQLDTAEPCADTGRVEAQYNTARSNLDANTRATESTQSTLDEICGRWDSQYRTLQQDELALERETVDALMSIDLGELRDPRWYERLIGAVGSFIGGVLESVVNLVEAIITGDLATFLWELKNLLDAALLILGTIALFTGVGAVVLFALSVAVFAVSALLLATQIPNPQTGETMGALEVALNGLGAAFGAGAAFRTAFPQGLAGGLNRGASTQVFTGGSGTIAGSISDLRNLWGLGLGGRDAHRAAMNLDIRSWPRHAAPNFMFDRVFNLSSTYTTARVGYQAYENVQTAVDLYGIAGTTGDFSGFNTANDVNGWAILDGPMGPLPTPPGTFGQYGSSAEQGTPLFGPADHTARTNSVVSQMVNSPQVHVVPAS